MLTGQGRRALALSILMTGCWVPVTMAQDQDAQALLESAAEALGGVEAVKSLKSLHLYGYAQTAYQWGGGNITADPDAPQKWQANNALERVWDLENNRFQILQRNNFLFPFAAVFGHSFALTNQVLDGDVAYNVNPDGTSSRVAYSNPGALNTDGVYDRTMWSLTNPVIAVHAALMGEAEAGNVRDEDGYKVVELTVEAGTLEIALDSESNLPHHITWSTAQSNLGQVEYTTTFVGYQPYGGLNLPMGWTTKLDWRDLVFQSTFVDGWVVNEEVADLTAPAEIVAADVPQITPPPLEVVEVTDRIWRISNGTTVIEFDDHMTLYELGGNQVVGKAVLDLAKTINPDKPVTELIVSHHHFDHTGGFRAAVAEGLKIYAHENIVPLLDEMASRLAPDFNDLVPEGRTDIEFVAISKPTEIGDADFPLTIYPLVANNHMGAAIFAYQPDGKVMIEADVGTAASDWQFWADSYQDNLAYYDLDVEIISPAHQKVFTHDELIEFIRPGAIKVQERCASYEERNEPIPGCPAFMTRDW